MIDFKAIGKKISDHLTQQRAVSGRKGVCLYRGPDGTSCAVGCLILNEDYQSGMEPKGGLFTGQTLLAAPTPQLNLSGAHRRGGCPVQRALAVLLE